MGDLIERRPYVQRQTLVDAAFPPGRFYYGKAHNVRSLQDGSIDALVVAAESLPTPYSAIVLQQLHGAASRVPESETAFPHRYVHYNVAFESGALDRANCDKIIRWTRKAWQALEPFAERAVYANVARDAGDEGQDRVREAFGPNYDRPLVLKSTTIPPISSAPTPTSSPRFESSARTAPSARPHTSQEARCMRHPQFKARPIL